MIRKFRFINLIVSTIFLGFISLRLGFIISDWLFPNDDNITVFIIAMKTILGIMGTLTIIFILSNLNWLLFKASSED